MATHLAPSRPRLKVYDEFGHAEQPLAQQRSQPEPAASAGGGSPSAQQWLTALARHCESAEGAATKAQLMEMLRGGSRSKDKVVAVTNQARQHIGKLFRQALPCGCC